MGIVKGRWKLRRHDRTCAYRTIERRHSLERTARILVRIQHANGQSELRSSHFDRQTQVRVVRDNDGELAIPVKPIAQEPRRKINVGALLLSLDALDRRRTAGLGMTKRHVWVAHEEMTVVNREVRARLQGADIRLLAHVLLRIGRTRGDQCREIPDPVDRVPGQQPLAQGGEIEPLHGPTLPRVVTNPVVQIEAVDVDVRLHDSLINGRDRLVGGLAPGRRSNRGDTRTVYQTPEQA